ncbi:hypothetical protein [Sporosarcina cascadiensis]|uniref:hypothetical protein n=1 Tax=Sporosarcina cascadiensis TaxID=2660747 RepID=UPI00129B11E8|nr:hypothetical protein [Sporosarcina cascadiensis]
MLETELEIENVGVTGDGDITYYRRGEMDVSGITLIRRKNETYTVEIHFYDGRCKTYCQPYIVCYET